MKFEINDLLKINFMVDGNFDLINATSNLKFESVLDIGLGEGGASTYFAINGKDVTSLGLDIESYNYPKELFKKLDVKVIETTFDDYKSEKKFDGIWASHVLEHVLNTGLFLEKCKNLLSDDGWLFIMVPPYKNQVVGGHINNGWNMGQLMYNLLLTGYDIKNGHFINHGYNICAFVQKSKDSLPNIRMDIGDIESTKDLWPIEVSQGFDGNIDKVNWFDKFKYYENERTIIEKQKKELESKEQTIKEKDEELESKEQTIKEKDEELESKEQTIKEKDEDLESKEQTIKEKDEVLESKKFGTKEIEDILLSLNSSVSKEKKLLYKNKTLKKIKDKSTFQKYQESSLINILQPIKRVPLIGNVMLLFKHKILKWDI